jgi:hypothetical protein
VLIFGCPSRWSKTWAGTHRMGLVAGIKPGYEYTPCSLPMAPTCVRKLDHGGKWVVAMMGSF